MEVVVLENQKSRLKFELKGEDHTFCNALTKELWTDKNVEIAGYRIEHSLISDPVFTIELKTGDAKKTLQGAIERLQKQNKELKEHLKTL